MPARQPEPSRPGSSAAGAPPSGERQEDLLLTSAQVAQMLHVSGRTVLNMIHSGQLKAHRLPGTRKFLFWRNDVVDLINANVVDPSEIADADDHDAQEPEAAVQRRRTTKPTPARGTTRVTPPSPKTR